MLFYVAKKYAPSIIFIDEVECVTTQRDKVTEHEASKRFKNEFLTLMDGLESENSGIFILAATNLPWYFDLLCCDCDDLTNFLMSVVDCKFFREIDHAFLRRFEKKILLNLPNPDERIMLIQKFLGGLKIPYETMGELVNISEGFSGDEIRVACKEIKMIEIRRKINSSSKNATERTVNGLRDAAIVAFKQVHPISVGIMKKHKDWSKNY